MRSIVDRHDAAITHPIGAGISTPQLNLEMRSAQSIGCVILEQRLKVKIILNRDRSSDFTNRLAPLINNK
jgi:hypothetical protein